MAKQTATLSSRVATRLDITEAAAETILTEVFESVYEEIKAGNSVTIRNFGNFYVRSRERSTWTFKFNPAQRLRACLGWSSIYKGAV